MKASKIIQILFAVFIVGDAMVYFYPDVKDMLMNKKSSSNRNSNNPKEVDFVVINRMTVPIDDLIISSQVETDGVLIDSIPVGDTARLHLSIGDTSEGTYQVSVKSSLKIMQHQLGYYVNGFATEGELVVVIKDSSDAELIYPDN